MAVPLTVRDVTVTNLLSGFRFLVEWTLNAEQDGVTVYKVFRSPNQDHGYNLVATIQSPGFQFVDKVPFTYGAIFYYKVIAISTTGAMSDLTRAPAVTDETFDDFEERPFRSTDIGAGSFIFGEIPGGALNNSNLNFTTSKYFRAGTLQVYVDGLRLQPLVAYTEGLNQNSFTLAAIVPLIQLPLISDQWPPNITDYMMVDYIAL